MKSDPITLSWKGLDPLVVDHRGGDEGGVGALPLKASTATTENLVRLLHRWQSLARDRVASTSADTTSST